MDQKIVWKSKVFIRIFLESIKIMIRIKLINNNNKFSVNSTDLIVYNQMEDFQEVKVNHVKLKNDRFYN